MGKNDEKTVNDQEEAAKEVESTDEFDFPGEDPDEAEAAELRKQIAAEDSGESQEEPEQNAEAQQQPEAYAAEPAQQQEDGKQGEGKKEGNSDESTPMVPKARLDEVLNERDQHRQNSAYWQGMYQQANMQGMAASQPGQAEQAPEPTPQEKIQAIRKERLDVAQKFDDGEITLAEVEAKRFELQDQENALQQEIMQANAAPQAQQQQTQQQQQDSLYLADKTAELHVQHPYAQKIEGDANWRYLTEMARTELGTQLTNDDRGTLLLRQKVAELTDTFGPIMTGETLSQPQSQQPAQGQQPAAPSQTAKDRAAKMGVAGQQPPNINAIGQGGGVTPEPTEAEILAMSEEELESLPASTRAKLLADV